MKLLIFLLTSLQLLASPICVRIGQGSVAPLHQQKLREHGVETVGVIDLDEKKKEEALSQGLKWFSSYDEAALEMPHIWDVCTPPDDHLNTIKKIIAVDPQACMIVEKPICMSSEVEELRKILETFQGKIVVNENYLFSDITEKVRQVALEELKLKPTRIVIEMDKNRTADFKKGRYVDPEGAFKYEGTHIVTILQSLLDSMHLKLPEKPTSVIYEDLSPSFPNQGSADITFQIGELQINLHSSMKGTLKNRFPPYGRETIEEHETAPRYRVVAIEGLSQEGVVITVVGFYEPLPNHERNIGEVVILANGQLSGLSSQVPDGTMGKQLGLAVDYLTGKTSINPCPPEKAFEILKILDAVLPKFH